MRKSERWLTLFIALWLLGVTAGVISLCESSLAAGPAGAPATHLRDAHLRADLLATPPGRPTLIMVLHPMCPCSRASLGELAAIQADCPGAFSTLILFSTPPGLAQNPASTGLWQFASHLGGTKLMTDTNGKLAQALGAATSGDVLFYDAAGILQFSGGITDARGHAGNNVGRAAIEAIAHQRVPSTQSTPVFGCAL